MRNKNLKLSAFSVVFGSGKVFCCDCLLMLPAPAKPANLQLYFTAAAADQVCIAAANQVCVAACICSFYGNLLALNFARFAHKISGCSGREVSVCSGREVSVCSGREVSVSAAAISFPPGSSCRRRASRTNSQK
ncbi:hypothetical protein [Methanimicrococcus hongohii]|uniref:hypothetical protein n=1 Tax=Methanimicrococcus hongohii TaxID=3028295 RepID=UPI002931A172|nr:hypothetical protein [Methanimicrococcus sp. Hf6]